VYGVQYVFLQLSTSLKEANRDETNNNFYGLPSYHMDQDEVERWVHMHIHVDKYIYYKYNNILPFLHDSSLRRAMICWWMAGQR
jgi:hypothetical protein